MTLLRLFATTRLRKINEDDLNKGHDYGVPFSEQQHMHGSCYISLFECKSFDHSDPLEWQNFRHLPQTFTQLWYYSNKVKINPVKKYSTIILKTK